MKKAFIKNILLTLIICILSAFNFTSCNEFDNQNISYPCTYSDGSAVLELIDENKCNVTNVYNGWLSGNYYTTISGSGTWSISDSYVTINLGNWEIKDKSGNIILMDDGMIEITLKAKIISPDKITYLGATWNSRWSRYMKKALVIVIPALFILIAAAFMFLSGKKKNQVVRKNIYYLNGDVTKGYIEVIDSNNLRFGNFTPLEIAKKVVSYYFMNLKFSEEDLKQIGERYLNGIEYICKDNELTIQTIGSFDHWSYLIYYPNKKKSAL